MATKTRRAPTAEQKEEAAQKRQRFRELGRKLAELTDDQRAQLVQRAGAVVTCEGRPLSVGNTLLLFTQLQTVTVVGGFWQWKAAGRKVMKGQRSLSIWIPTKRRDGEDAPNLDPAPAEGQGAAEPGKRRGKFVVGSVFDISQTEPDDGRPVPKIAAAQIDDDHAPGAAPFDSVEAGAEPAGLFE